MNESLSVSINPMFCYKNTFNYSIESQQNEKSTQEIKMLFFIFRAVSALMMGVEGFFSGSLMIQSR